MREKTKPPEASYYRARYYDPVTGRFLNEDPTGFKGGINFYGCVNNNPLNKTDPDGTGWLDCAKAMAELARATANFQKDLRNIQNLPAGMCPNPKHLKELQQRERDLQDALNKVIRHCGKYAGAGVAIATAIQLLMEGLPYLEFAGEVAIAAG